MGSKCMSCPELTNRMSTLPAAEIFTRERNRSFKAAVTKEPEMEMTKQEEDPKQIRRLKRQISIQEPSASKSEPDDQEFKPIHSSEEPKPKEEALTPLPVDKTRVKKTRERGPSPLPDLMEQAETPSDQPAPPFPSLSDSVLEGLSLHSSSPKHTDEYKEKEVEEKFNTLSIAFKTDKFTLPQRIDLQKRQRDQSEKNIETELTSLRCLINALYILSSTDSRMREHIGQVQQQIDIVQQSMSRMTSKSEILGAVQQEERMNKAFEIMVSHVENLKRIHEKEQLELKEMKQLVLNNKLITQRHKDDSHIESIGRPKLLTRRRASVATIQRSPPILSPDPRPRLFSLSSTFRPLDRRASLPCVTPLLQPFDGSSRRSSSDREKENKQDSPDTVLHNSMHTNGYVKESHSLASSTTDVRCRPMEEESLDELLQDSLDSANEDFLEYQDSYKDKIWPFLDKCLDIADTLVFESRRIIQPMESKTWMQKLRLLVACFLVIAGFFSVFLCFL